MKINKISFIIKKKIKFKKQKLKIINLYCTKTFLLFSIIIMVFIIYNKYYKTAIENLNKNFHKMFLYKEDEKKINNKNLINICMSLDNNIIYPTLVSMASALENNNNTRNILSYNLLLSNDFNKENIQIFESLKKKYPIIINYYIIPNIFNSFKRWSHRTHCHYHKILIPILFPYWKEYCI